MSIFRLKSPTVPGTVSLILTNSYPNGNPLLLLDLDVSPLPTCRNTYEFYGDLTRESLPIYHLKYGTYKMILNFLDKTPLFDNFLQLTCELPI